MKKIPYKLIINICIILIITALLSVYIIGEEGFSNIIYKLQNIDHFWFILGIILIIIYWLMESLILHIITTKLYVKQKFINSLKVTMIGQLFNNITPFASGGQPMQSAAMVKNGISVSNNTPILLMKFIVYQSALVIYTSVIMLLRFDYFKSEISDLISLSVIGFVINIGIIIFLFLIATKKKLIYSIIAFIYNILGKIKLMKNIDSKLEKIDESMNNFHDNFTIIRKRIKRIIIAFILSFIQITAFCAVTYAVYRSFGYNKFTIFDVISAQAFLMMIMSFIPTPGAGGAAEGGFYVIFGKFFNEADIHIALLCWRLITFYLPIIVGSFFVISYNKNKKIKEENILEKQIS